MSGIGAIWPRSRLPDSYIINLIETYGASSNSNIDGGFAACVYLTLQNIDGGSATATGPSIIDGGDANG